MTFDCVLFDIDNVLIDTRASYLAAIQKTVELYLNRPSVVSLKEIDQFKLLGGFNDDWDSCYGIIAFLETAKRLSIAQFRDLCPERPLGTQGLLKHLRILYERVKTPPYPKVARIFQEVYLGKKLFKGRLLYWKGPGLVEKEKLIFPKSLLEKIRKRGIRLAVVTGRNLFEARYALRRFSILKLFDGLVTIDDVRREEKKTGKILRKPNPWPILEAARRFSPHPNPLPFGERGKKEVISLSPQRGERIKGEGGKSLRFLYVGDLPDDILAAERARKFIRIKSVAFPQLSRDPKAALAELKKARPDFLLKKPADLLGILFR